MHLLISRPIKLAERTADQLERLGHSCSIEPLLKIEDTHAALPEGEFSGIIITSQNALVALNNYWPMETRKDIPVLVTGQTTLGIAKNMGFENCKSANGSAVDLFNNIPEWMPGAQRILYPCAEIIAHDPDEHLSFERITCVKWAVYRAKAVSNFSKTTLEAFSSEQIDAILLYSARSAQIFDLLWQKSGIAAVPPRIFSLSGEICAVLPDQMKKQCLYPPKPDEKELFKLISKSII